MAVRYGALDTNPIREVVLSQGSTKKAASRTALTSEELPRLRKHLRSKKKAARRDLPDIVDALAGLGCRIGELLALDWSKVNFQAGTIEGTVIREKGVGLLILPSSMCLATMPVIWRGCCSLNDAAGEPVPARGH